MANYSFESNTTEAAAAAAPQPAQPAAPWPALRAAGQAGWGTAAAAATVLSDSQL